MKLFVALVLAASAAFVLWSSGELPARVASHFGVSGRADAFMSRTTFTLVMLLAVTGVPCLVWLLQVWAARTKRSNIRNREHWFSAQHYPSTVQFLENHAAWFTVALVAFMSAVHWLVVEANTGRDGPPALNTTVFVAILVFFFLFVAFWVWAQHARFRKSN